jgi:hypothetical protein
LNRLLILERARLGNRGSIYAPRAAIWTSDRTYLEPDLFYLSAGTEGRLDPKYYGDGEIFARGHQLMSTVIQGLMIAVTDVFQD